MTLDLGSNQIGPAGMQHLANALRNNMVTSIPLFVSLVISSGLFRKDAQVAPSLQLWN